MTISYSSFFALRSTELGKQNRNRCLDTANRAALVESALSRRDNTSVNRLFDSIMDSKSIETVLKIPNEFIGLLETDLLMQLQVVLPVHYQPF